jgi:uncharacterized protein (TIGR03437 family)
MTTLRLLLAFLSISLVLPAQQWDRDEDDDPAARHAWFYSQRAFPAATIPPGARRNAMLQIARADALARLQRQAFLSAAIGQNSRTVAAIDAANWTLIGPRPTDAGTTHATAGRVNAIAIDPRNNDVIYIGAAEGGVWKTTDGGVNWTPLTDDQASLANGAIALDPNHPDTVYVGTGEENFAQDSYYGAGILKSTDGGATWVNILGPFLRDKIGALVVHPTNSQILLCTSTTGVWRSADAGATWTPVLTGATGISLAVDPTNGDSIYVSLGATAGNSKNGVYHSTDAGLTWKQVAGTGSASLPTSNVGRIEIAMAPSDPATLYVQIQNSLTASFGTLLGIYKTTDGGTTWTRLPVPASMAVLWGNQLWYDNPICVHPTDPNVVYSGGVQIFRTLDGGTTWTALAQAGSNLVSIHVDFHHLVFTPDGNKLLLANDGGMYSATGVNVPGNSLNWTNLNNTLAITQFYPGMAVDPARPDAAIGGAQDNGTQRYGGVESWNNVTCGDGGFQAIDPSNPALAYGSCQFIGVERTLNVGGTGLWLPAVYGIDQTDTPNTSFMAPLTIDPSNPQILYFGTYRLWQTRDSAGRWSAISPDLTGGKKGALRTIAVAPADSNVVYAGTSNSKVFSTSDAQNGASSAWTDRSAGLPGRAITHIAVDPLDSSTAYVTFSGFFTPGSITPDIAGHIFKTTDGGAHWSDASGNLANIPVNILVIDPDLPQTLYIATDAGVMVTLDGGANWSSLGKSLPKVAVLSLVLQRPTRVLRAATHGRSVWDILVPLSGAGLAPAIDSIAPASANWGGGDFTLTVTGSNFGPGTVVRWNGQSRPTTFVDSTHLTVAIPAADIAAVGRAAVTAFNAGNGGGSSNATSFTIGPPPQTTSTAFVNAANPSGGNALAPRSIASLFGTNLAPQVAVADLAPPLPFTLGGVTMTMGGGSVPLFFVSPTQINFQIPLFTLNGQISTILTVTQGASTTSITVQLKPYAPALFTTNAGGTGQASTLIAGTTSLAAPIGAFPASRPARIGEYLSIYATGLGDVSNRPSLGSASPDGPLATTLATPAITIGGVPATVSFSGLAPGFVGLYQINVQVPAGAPTGPDIPIVVTIGGVPSNTATIAVDPAA